MDETSNYQSIDETSENVISSRAILSKVRIKQIVFSLVVILFVSIGAITFTQKASSRSTSTGGPSSDNPTQNMPFLIPTRTPAPSPGHSTTPAPTPTPTPKDFSNDETPQMTPFFLLFSIEQRNEVA
uniref:Uncharacterized protein n=1 Tax=Globisporangium ultimum (strain ATCC 200006 / CBS 805.95 / DAOM BR144) TaxID=431595 RepID=K3WVN2_GLOUD